MTRLSGTSEPWRVVVVPHPFVERGGTKRRPALAIGGETFAPSGHAVLAMITTGVRRPWPGDTELLDYRDAGLRRPCIVRLKLFTLDRRLIRRTAGRLSERDRERVLDSLHGCLALADGDASAARRTSRPAGRAGGSARPIGRRRRWAQPRERRR